MFELELGMKGGKPMEEVNPAVVAAGVFEIEVGLATQQSPPTLWTTDALWKYANQG